jgi:tol-pal system protein YbgF
LHTQKTGTPPRVSLPWGGMTKSAALACFLVALLGEAGCFTAETSERRQLASLEKGIESDRFSVDRTTPRVDEKVSPPADEPARAARAPEPANVPASEPIEAEDSVEPAPRTVIRIWGKSAPSVEVVPADTAAKDSTPGRSPAASPAPSPANAGQAQRAYDGALSLVNAHAYDKAAGALGMFLLEWPSDPNASNALYWQAECYFAMGEYAHASELYEQTIERFPKSSRVPDCLLMLGRCQQKQGDDAKAKGTFHRLGAEYPQSEASRRIPPGN